MKKFYNNKTVIVSVFLITIISFGAFMRLWHLGYSSYWIDEGFTLMQAQGISEHGYPLLNSGETEWKDMLIPYIVSPITKFSGFDNAWILRLPAAIFGIASIYIGYLLGLRLFSFRTGIFFSFYIASCHWYIAWSQQVRGYSAAIFFVLLFFLMLVLHNRKENDRYFYVIISALFLGILAKKIAIFLLVPLVVYLLIKKKYALLSATLLFSVAMLVYAFFGISNDVSFTLVNYLRMYFLDYLIAYFGIFIILAFVGMVIAFYNKGRDLVIHVSILSFILISIICISAFFYVLEKRYLILVTPFIFLYAAYLIDWIGRKFKYQILVSTLLFMISILLGSYLNQGIIMIPQRHYSLEHYTPQPNYKKAYEHIKKDGFSSSDYVISANPVVDVLYLGRSNYYIPWSLTGRGDSVNLIGDREYYTGVRKLYGNGEKTGIDKIHSLQERGDVYVVFDSLAQKRMSFDIWDDITEEGDRIFVDGSNERVFVYYFPGSASP